MKKTTLILGIAAIACVTIANTAEAQSKKDKKAPVTYIPVGGGTDYRLVDDKPGAVYPKTGDFLEVHLNIAVEDSIVFDTRTAMNGEPVPLVLQETGFAGDLMNALKYLTQGDSAVIRQSTDSLAAGGAQLAPWMKKGIGQKVHYNVRVVTFKTQEQKKKEDDANMAMQKGVDEKIIKDYLASKKITAQKSATGLYYKIDEPGKGESPKPGQRVSVNYTGMLVNGKKFDSNVDPAFNHVQAFKFNIGQGQVIAGWDEGIALLKPGGKGTLFIPSTLAYGPRAMGADIPANSVLIFEVELVEIVTGIGE